MTATWHNRKDRGKASNRKKQKTAYKYKNICAKIKKRLDDCADIPPIITQGHMMDAFVGQCQEGCLSLIGSVVDCHLIGHMASSNVPRKTNMAMNLAHLSVK